MTERCSSELIIASTGDSCGVGIMASSPLYESDIDDCVICSSFLYEYVVVVNGFSVCISSSYAGVVDCWFVSMSASYMFIVDDFSCMCNLFNRSLYK